MSYDHDYEPGAFGVCRRCGEERHGPAGSTVGSGQKQRYRAPLLNPDNAPAKQEAYCAELASLSDADLRAVTERDIWLSAFAANNPQSCYHWMADACHDEAMRRAKPEIYDAAYKAVCRQEGIG